MDPYEQRLRDEVLYLHSLWRQGPPRRHISTPNPSTSLHPSNAPKFKKKSKTKRGKKLPPVSEKEWPCEEPSPPATTTGWPDLNLRSAPAIQSPSAEEKAKISANQVQQKGLKAAREFYAGNVDSDDDSDEEMEVDGDEVSEDYNFFVNLFMEDSDLRSYYEKNHEAGEFSCLVCCGIGKKVGKKFKDCSALVQHALTIANTKKKRAHRAYGQVLCKVLGWDITRLPAIVLTSANPLTKSLAESDKLQGNTGSGSGLKEQDLLKTSSFLEIIQKAISDVCQKQDLQKGKSVDTMDAVTNDLMVCKKEDLQNQNSVDTTDAVTNDMMVCEEGSLVVDDSNKVVELLANGGSSTLQGDAEEGVVEVKSFQDEGIGTEVKHNDNIIDISSSDDDPSYASEDDPSDAGEDDPSDASEDDPSDASEDDPSDANEDDSSGAGEDDPSDAGEDGSSDAGEDDSSEAEEVEG